jgi:K+-sensing histidine kinase KdpD
MNRLINISATSETRSQEVYALPIKQIVVAVDLTARSEKTVEYAIEIARSFGARIHLAYVRTPNLQPKEFMNISRRSTAIRSRS